MPWNWQLKNWPKFTYDTTMLPSLERKFFQGAGGAFAVLKQLDEDERREFVVEILSSEGLKSSEIEGEILERESLQSSIRRHFKMQQEDIKVRPKEKGMGDLMWMVYNTFDQPLTHAMLHEWHRVLMSFETRIEDVGQYRTHTEPMQIVSGRYDKQTVYFEAPPSSSVPEEMDRFIEWFNHSKGDEFALARASIAHLYFESIHPFEDGNGRIGRVLVEKALSEALGQPTLIATSEVIARRKKEYYAALGACNKTLDANKFVSFFSEIIVQSQEESYALIDFLIKKSKLLSTLEGKINERQEKVLLRLFAEGIKGFSGGLSTENYIKITKASRATATRDLNDLIDKGALYKTGQLKHTRYWLNI